MTDPLIIPTIYTPHLQLSAALASDAHGIYQLYSDPVITRYLGIELMGAVEDAQRWLDHHTDRQAKGLGMLMTIRKIEGDDIIGTCSIEEINSYHHNATIGYSLAHAYWGKGLMREALLAVVDYLFTGLTEVYLQRLQAWTQSENVSSVRLLERLGFTFEGRLRQLFFWHGLYKDVSCYSLLRDEYLPRSLPCG